MVRDALLFQDATRPVDERAADLLGRMTLVEKVAQLGSWWVYTLLDGVKLDSAKAKTLMPDGVGHITRIGGASNVTPTESAALANSIQKWLQENTRLGIPAVVHEECCSGYMARGATVFPQAIGVASTWQPELVEAMGDVIRQQMRSVGGHHALAPVLDVARDARWGRVEETFGEDPYLIAQMGMAYVRGIQGPNLANGVVATGKHFVGYSMSEGGMNWAPPHIMPRELREIYLYPFEAAVREAGLASIMNGYHEIDGIPCGANKWLLTDLLRGEWGFDGTVVADYFAINQLADYHHITADNVGAAHLALAAGLDVELPSTRAYNADLVKAVEAGQVPLELIDQSVLRLLKQKFSLGLFENPYVEESTVVFDTPDQRKLARQLATNSMVLLRNEGNLLPLPKTLRSVAVIGPNADSIRNLFGDYAYPAHLETLVEMTHGNNPFGMSATGSVVTVEDFIVTQSILTAFKSADDLDMEIHYARGCDVRDESKAGFAEAVEAAKKAEVAIVVVGDKAGLTDDCTSGEARDRAVLDLPGVQADLVKAIYDTGTPVVLLLVNGRPITLGWMAEQIPAILECWFPSEEGAAAIKDVLFGDANPGGKLPISFPRHVGQIPVFYSHRPSGGRSHWKTDYVETSVKPLYPFGFGLSYTTFEVSNLRVSERAQAQDSFSVQVDVTNTGAREGDEVVQVYTHQLVTGITRPLKELKAFQRVTVPPGQTRTVTFTLPVRLLAFINAADQCVVAPGPVTVMVGTSSADLPLQGTLLIEGDVTPVERAFVATAQVQ
ncbi:MAG TPA: glycoside hydrolase family 3 N-terminal domain-containing protein [Aggregatilineales bacterium]|nr:glycoside hydrolase family 3 N-terminal domain-containing protein [Aggregatilineales bacterium]